MVGGPMNLCFMYIDPVLTTLFSWELVAWKMGKKYALQAMIMGYFNCRDLPEIDKMAFLIIVNTLLVACWVAIAIWPDPRYSLDALGYQHKNNINFFLDNWEGTLLYKLLYSMTAYLTSLILKFEPDHLKLHWWSPTVAPEVFYIFIKLKSFKESFMLHKDPSALKVLVMTIDALGHF